MASPLLMLHKFQWKMQPGTDMYKHAMEHGLRDVWLQEAARLMAAGEYELALPVALDAVQQGQALFKPSPALQLFPLYLLAAQVRLHELQARHLGMS